MKTLFSMLKQNVEKAQMLTYVFAFNAPSWVEELEFVYGAKDKEQWKVDKSNISDKSLPQNIDGASILIDHIYLSTGP